MRELSTSAPRSTPQGALQGHRCERQKRKKEPNSLRKCKNVPKESPLQMETRNVAVHSFLHHSRISQSRHLRGKSFGTLKRKSQNQLPKINKQKTQRHYGGHFDTLIFHSCQNACPNASFSRRDDYRTRARLYFLLLFLVFFF